MRRLVAGAQDARLALEQLRDSRVGCPLILDARQQPHVRREVVLLGKLRLLRQDDECVLGEAGQAFQYKLHDNDPWDELYVAISQNNSHQFRVEQLPHAAEENPRRFLSPQGRVVKPR